MTRRSLARFIAVSTLCACLAVAASACGGAPVKKEVAPTAPVKKGPATPDAFRDFGGERVKTGEVVRLRSKSKAVLGVEVVIRLLKVEWMTHDMPDGRKVKDGIAVFMVHKGQKERRTRVQLDDTKRSLGCKITVKGVGEAYVAERMDYLPWADVVVDPR
jgi:hypothetical protein